MVLINNVIAIHSPMDHFTDEAWAILDSMEIGIYIERFAIVHQYPPTCAGETVYFFFEHPVDTHRVPSTGSATGRDENTAPL